MRRKLKINKTIQLLASFDRDVMQFGRGGNVFYCLPCVRIAVLFKFKYRFKKVLQVKLTEPQIFDVFMTQTEPRIDFIYSN